MSYLPGILMAPDPFAQRPTSPWVPRLSSASHPSRQPQGCGSFPTLPALGQTAGPRPPQAHKGSRQPPPGDLAWEHGSCDVCQASWPGCLAGPRHWLESCPAGLLTPSPPHGTGVSPDPTTVHNSQASCPPPSEEGPPRRGSQTDLEGCGGKEPQGRWEWRASHRRLLRQARPTKSLPSR